MLQQLLLRALRIRLQLPAKYGALVDTAADQGFSWGQHSSNWTKAQLANDHHDYRHLPVDALLTLAMSVDGAGETILRTLAEAFGVPWTSDYQEQLRPARDLAEAALDGTELAADLQRTHRLAMRDGTLDAEEQRELLEGAVRLRDHFGGIAERLERDLAGHSAPEPRRVAS